MAEAIPFHIRFILPNGNMDCKSYEQTPKLFKCTSFLSPPHGQRNVPSGDTQSSFIKFCLEDLMRSSEFYSELIKAASTENIVFVYGPGRYDLQTNISDLMIGPYLHKNNPTVEFHFKLFIQHGSIRYAVHSGDSWFHTMYHLAKSQAEILDFVLEAHLQQPNSVAHENEEEVDETGTDVLLHRPSSGVEETTPNYEMRAANEKEVDKTGTEFECSISPKRAKYGGSFIELEYIPMTQETPEFDYECLSQNTTDEPKTRPPAGSYRLSINSSAASLVQTGRMENAYRAAGSSVKKNFILTKKTSSVGVAKASNARAPTSTSQGPADPVHNPSIKNKHSQRSSQQAPTISTPQPSAPSVPMFQTAGRKSAIVVSEESLLQAGQLLASPKFKFADKIPTTGSNESNVQPAQNAVDQYSGENSGSNAARASTSTSQGRATTVRNPYSKNEHSQRSSQQAPTTQQPTVSLMPSFQTAGRKSAIVVSDESLLKAGRLLETPKCVSKISTTGSNESNVQPAQNAVDQYSGENSVSNVAHASTSTSQDRATTVRNPYLKKKRSLPAATIPIQQPTVPFVPMFQTAGRKSAIRVSDESLLKAGQLLASPKHASKNSTNRSNVSNVQPAPIAPAQYSGENSGQHNRPMQQQSQLEMIADATARYLSHYNNQTPPRHDGMPKI